MCDPISIGVGIAVATTAVSTISQIQSANAYNKALKEQHAEQIREINQQTAQEITDRLREARREQGRIMVAAGESGLNTASPVVQGLLSDAAMQAELANDTSMANRESRMRASDAEANSKMQAKPTVLGAGLQIGLAGLNAATSLGAFKKPPGGASAAPSQGFVGPPG